MKVEILSRWKQKKSLRFISLKNVHNRTRCLVHSNTPFLNLPPKLSTDRIHESCPLLDWAYTIIKTRNAKTIINFALTYYSIKSKRMKNSHTIICVGFRKKQGAKNETGGFKALTEFQNYYFANLSTQLISRKQCEKNLMLHQDRKARLSSYIFR